MIPRELAPHLRRLATQYPVVTMTGPRQSGKTTLVKAVFPDKPYVNLESPDVRRVATEDPRGFLGGFPDGAVIDEVQRAPDLLSYIQTIVDERSSEGLFILTGSANLDLMEGVSQSLAGRTALATLLPFTMSELSHLHVSELPLEEIAFRGFYPRLHDKNLNPTEALGFYVGTYVERDVRSLLNVRDLNRFETFLKMCASRTARILNLSSLANDCGINLNTAKSWLSILETTYILHRLPPHYRNYSKRLIKSPKICFHDVGLVCYLLGITHPAQITTHPLRGAIFETLVISEILKLCRHRMRPAKLYFFRDHVGNEVDLLVEGGPTLLPVEVKSGATFASDMVKGLGYYGKLASDETRAGFLVYGGEDSFEYQGVSVRSFRDVDGLPLP